ncbi:hypothetical protein CARUB_v10003288mg, partial [Capsella rubella]
MNQQTRSDLIPNLANIPAPVMSEEHQAIYWQEHLRRQRELLAQLGTGGASVPVGVVNMVPYKHVVVMNSGDHKPLNVGTIVYIIETRALFGRVEGYFFGSVTNPHYVVRLLDSEMHIFHDKQLGPFSVNQNYSNQQQIGLPEPRPEINFNPQTQSTMQSQEFIAGTSSYPGRRGGRAHIPLTTIGD